MCKMSAWCLTLRCEQDHYDGVIDIFWQSYFGGGGDDDDDHWWPPTIVLSLAVLHGRNTGEEFLRYPLAGVFVELNKKKKKKNEGEEGRMD